MDRLDMYSEFAIVGTIRHLTDRNDGCSIDRKELIAKLTKLFGDKARAENALEKAESWELVIVNDKGCSLSAHTEEIIDSLSESWERNILPRIE